MSEKLVNEAVLPFRKMGILACMALGCSDEETSRFLGVSVNSVRAYLRRVVKKLGAKGRAHAVMLALLRGFLDLETLEELENRKEPGVDWTGEPLVGQILELVALGYRNKDIGRFLNYSEGYIRDIVHFASHKSGARNRVHLITLSLIQRKLDFQDLKMDMAAE